MILKINWKHKAVSQNKGNGKLIKFVSGSLVLATIVSFTSSVKLNETKSPILTKSIKTTAPKDTSSTTESAVVFNDEDNITIVLPAATEVVKEAPSETVTNGEQPAEEVIEEEPAVAAANKPIKYANNTLEEANKYVNENLNLTDDQKQMFFDINEIVTKNPDIDLKNYLSLVSSFSIRKDNDRIYNYKYIVDNVEIECMMLAFGNTLEINGYDDNTLAVIKDILISRDPKCFITQKLIDEKLGFKEVYKVPNVGYIFMGELLTSDDMMKIYSTKNGMNLFYDKISTLLNEEENLEFENLYTRLTVENSNTLASDEWQNMLELMKKAYSKEFPSKDKQLFSDEMITDKNYVFPSKSAYEKLMVGHTVSDIKELLMSKTNINEEDKLILNYVLGTLSTNDAVNLDIVYWNMRNFEILKYSGEEMPEYIKDFAGCKRSGINAIDINLENATGAYYKSVIIHEFWHFLSSGSDGEVSNLISTNSDGVFLREGITEELSERDTEMSNIVPSYGGTYLPNRYVVEILCELIGDEKVYRAYNTTTGIHDIANELAVFMGDDVNRALSLLESLDLLHGIEFKTQDERMSSILGAPILELYNIANNSLTIPNGVDHNYSVIKSNLIDLGAYIYTPALVDAAEKFEIASYILTKEEEITVSKNETSKNFIEDGWMSIQQEDTYSEISINSEIVKIFIEILGEDVVNSAIISDDPLKIIEENIASKSGDVEMANIIMEECVGLADINDTNEVVAANLGEVFVSDFAYLVETINQKAYGSFDVNNVFGSLNMISMELDAKYAYDVLSTLKDSLGVTVNYSIYHGRGEESIPQHYFDNIDKNVKTR